MIIPVQMYCICMKKMRHFLFTDFVDLVFFLWWHTYRLHVDVQDKHILFTMFVAIKLIGEKIPVILLQTHHIVLWLLSCRLWFEELLGVWQSCTNSPRWEEVWAMSYGVHAHVNKGSYYYSVHQGQPCSQQPSSTSLWLKSRLMPWITVAIPGLEKIIMTEAMCMVKFSS